MSGDEFKIDFPTMDEARADGLRTAAQISDSAHEQTTRMQGMLGAAWGDNAAEAAFQSYQMRQKATGYHTDGINAEATAHGNVGELGQQTLSQVTSLMSSI